jgi:hypothetical protein
MLASHQDKRKARRRRMRRAAEVFFGAAELPMACVIWDISAGGARLAVAHPTMHLPRRFTLSIGKVGPERRKCEVVWTDARFVGVRFV